MGGWAWFPRVRQRCRGGEEVEQQIGTAARTTKLPVSWPRPSGVGKQYLTVHLADYVAAGVSGGLPEGRVRHALLRLGGDQPASRVVWQRPASRPVYTACLPL